MTLMMPLSHSINDVVLALCLMCYKYVLLPAHPWRGRHAANVDIKVARCLC